MITRYQQGRRFEKLVAEYYMAMGYWTSVTPGSKGANSVDVIAEGYGKAIYSQVKKDCKPTAKEYRELQELADKPGCDNRTVKTFIFNTELKLFYMETYDRDEKVWRKSKQESYFGLVGRIKRGFVID